MYHPPRNLPAPGTIFYTAGLFLSLFLIGMIATSSISAELGRNHEIGFRQSIKIVLLDALQREMVDISRIQLKLYLLDNTGRTLELESEVDRLMGLIERFKLRREQLQALAEGSDSEVFTQMNLSIDRWRRSNTALLEFSHLVSRTERTTRALHRVDRMLNEFDADWLPDSRVAAVRPAGNQNSATQPGMN